MRNRYSSERERERETARGAHTASPYSILFPSPHSPSSTSSHYGKLTRCNESQRKSELFSPQPRHVRATCTRNISIFFFFFVGAVRVVKVGEAISRSHKRSIVDRVHRAFFLLRLFLSFLFFFISIIWTERGSLRAMFFKANRIARIFISCIETRVSRGTIF